MTTIYKEGGYEVIDVPDLKHTATMQCDILILTCKTQRDVEHIARKWFGRHKRLIVALIDTDPEDPLLCPAEHLVRVNNMTREGLIKIVQLIRAYK